MKLFVITRPDWFPDEVDTILSLFHEGLETLHLRKPDASEAEVESFLRSLPRAYLSRIVLHQHFRLATFYPLKGIHLNHRHPFPPPGYTGGTVSRSCHTLDEVKQYKTRCDYVFLSPVFDSISKEGYAAAFHPTDLCHARNQGIIDNRVIALGGIDENRFQQLRTWGFGGAAVLGDIWKQTNESLIPHFRRLQRLAAETVPTVLTIAGSDSSGGAGIQADIKALSALGIYAASAITAVTAQNTQGVYGVYPIPPDFVATQIQRVWNDLRIDAVKIGMVGNASVVRTLCTVLQSYRGPIVYDPVMVSTSGHRLMEAEAVDIVCQDLLPCCTLVTPNLAEARLLSGMDIDTVDDMEHAAQLLSQRYHTAFLLKGGHLAGKQMCDILCHEGHVTRYTLPRVDSCNLHGTGCTLSSAIAAYLARKNPLEEAVRVAKAYVHRAILEASHLQIGQGQGPLWHFFA